MRAPEPRRVAVAATVLALVVLGGCGSGEDPPTPPGTATPSPSASGGPSPTATPAATPADGVTLESLGFRNGPIRQLTLPRTALLSAAVDQTDNVTAVLTQPPPADVADHLRRTLPTEGFTITADAPDGAALTFTGHGWTGSFTVGAGTAAVLLRPA